MDAGVDLRPDQERLHVLAAEIGACCGVSPLKAYRLARGMRVREAVETLHASRRDPGLAACKLTREQLIHFESGTRPGEGYRDVLCRFYCTGPVQMGRVTDYSPNGMTPTTRADNWSNRPGRWLA